MEILFKKNEMFLIELLMRTYEYKNKHDYLHST